MTPSELRPYIAEENLDAFDELMEGVDEVAIKEFRVSGNTQAEKKTAISVVYKTKDGITKTVDIPAKLVKLGRAISNLKDRPYKDERTAYKIRGLSDLESIPIKLPSGATGYVISGKLREGRIRAAEKQVRHAIERGAEHAKNADERIEGTKPDGTKTRFHAGEITMLGVILDAGRTRKGKRMLGVMSDPRTQFLNGLSYLETQVELDQNGDPVLDENGKKIYLYRFDFRPQRVRVDGKLVKANPHSVSLKIMGNTTFAKAIPVDLRRRMDKIGNTLRNAWGYMQSLETRVEQFEPTNRKIKDQESGKEYNDMFEWMIDRVVNAAEDAKKFGVDVKVLEQDRFRALVSSLNTYGLLSDNAVLDLQNEMQATKKRATRPIEEADRGIATDVSLLWSVITSQETTNKQFFDVVDGQVVNRYIGKSTPSHPEGEPIRQTAVGPRKKGDSRTHQQRTSFDSTLEEDQDATDEYGDAENPKGYNRPSEAFQQSQISTFADRAHA
jgi:hypothetical protein